jgi:hypothetical protein
MSQYTALPTSDENESTVTSPQQVEKDKSSRINTGLRGLLYFIAIALFGLTAFKLGQYSTRQTQEQKAPTEVSLSTTSNQTHLEQEKPGMHNNGKLNVG